MLYVLVKAAGQRYALPALAVEEVAPLIRLSPLPGAPDFVAGVMNLRGEPVAVADLTLLLCGRASRPWGSTRILAVRVRREPAGAQQGVDRSGPLLGLLAERVMRTVRIEAHEIRPPQAPAAPWVTGVAVTERGVVEILDPLRVLPAELVESLFAPGAAS